MEKFVSDGLKLAYRVEGQGHPVLLIHGFGSTHAVNWVDTGWVKALVREGYRVIMYDGRGHGQSDKPHDQEAYSLSLMAEDAVALLDHLGEPGADVVGYSMGAMVALVIAMNHAERVDHVVAAGVGENLLEPSREADSVADALLADSLKSVTTRMGRMFRAFADQNRQDRQALAACWRAVRQPFPVEGLQAISRPVMVIAGRQDDQAGAPEPLAAHIPGAISSTVPGCDHMKAVGAKGTRLAVLSFLSDELSELPKA